MKWHSRAFIIFALLLLLVVTFYLFQGEEKAHYSTEATVQLLRDEPSNEDQVSSPRVEEVTTVSVVEEGRTTQVEEPKIEVVREGSVLFINDCSDVIAIRLDKEPLLLKPHERGYLERPVDQERVALEVFRKTNGKTEKVLEKIIHLSDKFHLTMTASEGEDGKFLFRGERVYLEKPESRCDR